MPESGECQHDWYDYAFNGHPGKMCANCHTWIPS